MIPRSAPPTLERLAKGIRVVALTRPRQSGEATLTKWTWICAFWPTSILMALCAAACTLFGTVMSFSIQASCHNYAVKQSGIEAWLNRPNRTCPCIYNCADFSAERQMFRINNSVNNVDRYNRTCTTLNTGKEIERICIVHEDIWQLGLI